MNTLKTYVPTQGSLAAIKVIRQTPEIDAALPFVAPDGTLVKASPTGLPFIGIIGGRLVVSLRKPGAEPLGAGEEYGGRASDFGTPAAACAAARQTKVALKALVQHAACNVAVRRETPAAEGDAKHE
ncbi:MAG: hypothetical protein FJ279_03605 [Planctomycetes bacterium]|nr:hypothetical protein [Planctomycetota bacterium]